MGRSQSSIGQHRRTEAMANFVAGAGGQADLFTPGEEFSADLVSNYSALAFGCPSMGAEQLEAEFEPCSRR